MASTAFQNHLMTSWHSFSFSYSPKYYWTNGQPRIVHEVIYLLSMGKRRADGRTYFCMGLPVLDIDVRHSAQQQVEFLIVEDGQHLRRDDLTQHNVSREGQLDRIKGGTSPNHLVEARQQLLQLRLNGVQQSAQHKEIYNNYLNSIRNRYSLLRTLPHLLLPHLPYPTLP